MIVVASSASRLNVMDSCWELYNLTYNRRWTPKEKDSPLERGDLVHVMFSHYYREKMKGRWRTDLSQHGIVIDESVNMARRAAVELELEQKEIDETIGAAKASLLFHQRDGMEVYAVEEPFTKVLYEVPDREENGVFIPGVRILWEGKVDLVASLPNQPTSVWDHKSEGRKSTPIVLDNQFTGSAWAFGVDTVVVNKVGFQSSVKEEEKFRRVFLDYSAPHIINEWRTDAIKTILEAIERHKREGSGKPDWPRNRTSCNKYSGCVFRQVCAAKPEVRNVKLMTWYRVRPEHELYKREGIIHKDDAVIVE
jgi:hypothetical protein